MIPLLPKTPGMIPLSPGAITKESPEDDFPIARRHHEEKPLTLVQVTEAIKDHTQSKVAAAVEHYQQIIKEVDVTLSVRGGDTRTHGKKEQKVGPGVCSAAPVAKHSGAQMQPSAASAAITLLHQANMKRMFKLNLFDVTFWQSFNVLPFSHPCFISTSLLPDCCCQSRTAKQFSWLKLLLHLANNLS